jgi:hypothetical protein
MRDAGERLEVQLLFEMAVDVVDHRVHAFSYSAWLRREAAKLDGLSPAVDDTALGQIVGVISTVTWSPVRMRM